MKRFRPLLFLAALVLFSCGAVAAQSQEEVKTYLVQTEPLLVKFRQNVGEFLPKVQGLREKGDLIGLKQTADEFSQRWEGMMGELDKIQPPQEASEYHQAMRSLLELQKESNDIMSETLGHHIGVLLEARKMKEAGSSEEEIQAFKDANKQDKEKIIKRTSAVKAATQEADSTLKSERKRLLTLIGENGEKPEEEPQK